jgi:hypothetical protein
MPWRRALQHDPLLEDAMRAAGFTHNPTSSQPGSWISPRGVPVDLMVPEQLAGAGGSRSVRIAPHSDRATRRTAGLEAEVVDQAPMIISALDPEDTRRIEVNVAGPAALLVAMLHKLGERQDAPGRLLDKDAHDVYRLLVGTDSATIAATLRQLQANDLSGSATRMALTYLAQLFAKGPHALGATMAGRAEQLVGAPETVSASASVLAEDLLALV